MVSNLFLHHKEKLLRVEDFFAADNGSVFIPSRKAFRKTCGPPTGTTRPRGAKVATAAPRVLRRSRVLRKLAPSLRKKNPPGDSVSDGIGLRKVMRGGRRRF